MQAAGVDSVEKLAEILGVKPNTVSTWKARGIPAKKILESSQIVMCAAHWLATGKGEMCQGEAGEALAAHGRAGQDAQPSEPPLDRDLLIEAATIIRMAEDKAGVRVKPEKFGELILMLYDEYASGAEVTPEKIIKLVRLAA